MEILRRVVPQGLEVKSFQDVQHLQGGDPLTVGRQFKEPNPSVSGGNWLYPSGTMLRKISGCQLPAQFLQRGYNLLRNGASIEGIPSATGDLPERVGQIGLNKYLAHSRSATFHQIGAGRVGMSFELFDALLPACRDDFRNRKSLFGV